MLMLPRCAGAEVKPEANQSKEDTQSSVVVSIKHGRYMNYLRNKLTFRKMCSFVSVRSQVTRSTPSIFIAFVQLRRLALFDVINPVRNGIPPPVTNLQPALKPRIWDDLTSLLTEARAGTPPITDIPVRLRPFGGGLYCY